jgi:adenosylmethionine-8-amino-7-oxononanoate aminotransferase
LVREHVYEAFARGSRRFPLGHTWDGAPLACGVGLAVLEAMRSEGLVERVRDRGAKLLEELGAALHGIPMVREVRGHGYLLGASYVDPRDGHSFLPPELRVGGRIDDAAFERGLIVLSTQPTRDGYAGDQTLFAPPFTTSDDELAEMVSRFADTVRHVADDVDRELGAHHATTGAER